MEENTQHFLAIMLYYFKKVKNATETRKKICSVCGGAAVTDRTCQKWFVKFRAGGFSLDDAPRSGRPADVDSDPIETFTENSQCSATQETVNILKLSKSIKLLVKMKNMPFILHIKSYGLFG